MQAELRNHGLIPGRDKKLYFSPTSGQTSLPFCGYWDIFKSYTIPIPAPHCRHYSNMMAHIQKSKNFILGKITVIQPRIFNIQQISQWQLSHSHLPIFAQIIEDDHFTHICEPIQIFIMLTFVCSKLVIIFNILWECKWCHTIKNVTANLHDPKSSFTPSNLHFHRFSKKWKTCINKIPSCPYYAAHLSPVIQSCSSAQRSILYVHQSCFAYCGSILRCSSVFNSCYSSRQFSNISVIKNRYGMTEYSAVSWN